jgi:hypothetical protein
MGIRILFDLVQGKAHPVDEDETLDADDFEHNGSEADDFIASAMFKYKLICNARFGKKGSPSAYATITKENNKNVVVFDDNLFPQLCKLYFIYGWQIIMDVEKSFTTTWTTEKPKGLFEYFILTKQLLAILIRHSLINIEIKAKAVVIKNLTDQKDKIKKAILQYGFINDERKGTIKNDPISGELVKVPYKKINPKVPSDEKNKTLSDQLYENLGQVADIQANIEDILEVNTNTKAVNSWINILTVLFDPAAVAAGQYVKFPIDNISVEKYQKQLLAALQKLKEKHFLGLLLFTGLRKNFDKIEKENALYTNAIALQNEIETILKEVQNIKSSTNQSKQSNIPGLIAWPGEDNLKIDNFDNITQSLEEKVVDYFYKKKDVSFLNVAVLDYLVKTGQVNKDSFEYPVLFQYKECLLAYLQAIKDKQKSKDDFFNTVGRFSSLFSLTAAIPVVGEFTAPVALVLDIGLLFHTVSSIDSQFESLSTSSKDNLAAANPDDEAYTNAMLQTGSLISACTSFKEEIFLQLSKEALIILIGATAEKEIIHKAIRWRNYANDIAGLFPDQAEK